jgi:hypothetical protein
MALFTVKPSRGTIAFFVLLGLGLTVRYGYNHREQAVVARDAPLTHSVRRLLRCVVGRDADQLLWPRPADDDTRVWAQRLNTRLRLAVTEHHSAQWPTRCVTMAQRVMDRLGASTVANRSYSHAAESLRLLNSMTSSRATAIAITENGRLGVSLAQLALETIKSSIGSESGWTSPLPFEPMDLHPLHLAQPALGTALPRGADVATFAAPEWILYQDIADRRTHAMLFGPNGSPQDVVVGAGAPLRVQNNGTSTLLASDDSDALLPLETRRPTPVQLPPAVRSGLHHIEGWQSVKSAGHRWFAYTDQGTAHVWSTPEGSTRWEERIPVQFRDIPIAAIALVGEPETSAPEAQPAAGAERNGAPPVGVRAYVLRHAVHGVAFERWDFAPPAPAALAHASAADAATPSSAELQNPPQLTAFSLIASAQEPMRRTVLAAETVALHRPRARVCVSGTRAHFVVTADEAYAFFSASQYTARASSLLASRVGALSGGRVEFSCDGSRSLLLADVAGRPGALLQYDSDSDSEPRLMPIALPELTVERKVDAAALVPGGVVLLLRTPSSVRSFVSTDGHSWLGGTLLAALESPVISPPDHPEITASPGYTITINAMSTARNRVAALAVARGRSVRALRFTSEDGGLTWH